MSIPEINTSNKIIRNSRGQNFFLLSLERCPQFVDSLLGFLCSIKANLDGKQSIADSPSRWLPEVPAVGCWEWRGTGIGGGWSVGAQTPEFLRKKNSIICYNIFAIVRNVMRHCAFSLRMR